MPPPTAKNSRQNPPRIGVLVAAWTFFALPAAAQTIASAEPVSPQRQHALEERARKVAEARAHGYWIVGPGEHLRLIARQFCPDDKLCERYLSERIFARNKDAAFMGGDPDRLRPGARLDLSGDVLEPRMRVADSKATAAAPSPPAPAAPPSTPSAVPPAPAAPSPASPAPPGPATTVPAPEFAVGPPTQRAAPPPPSYVDQLIEGAPAESEAAVPVGEAALEPGQRSFSAEYRMEGRYPPGGGHGLEQGVNLSMRRETLNYGDFYIDAAVRHDRLAPSETEQGRPTGGRFTLYQQRFPLAEGWLADSAFGIVRTPPSALVNSSYRVFLPTSLMSGASTLVSDGRNDFIAYGGHVGQLLGDAVQGFDPTTGNVAGVGYATRSGPWTLGGQAIALRGNSQVPDHEAATLAGEYGHFGDDVHDKAQLVADKDGRAGGWFDGDLTTGRLRNRFGLFTLDPDLKWGDGSVANDQRGGYYRADWRMLRYTLAGGLDVLQTNIRDDPTKAATKSATGYGTFSLRIDRDLTVGGGATYQDAHNRFTAAPRGSQLTLNGYASWNTSLGLSRWDLTTFRGTATGLPDNTIDTFSWNQEWPAAGYVRMSSTLTLAREKSLGLTTDRSSFGISAHGTFLNDGLWDTSVVYGRVEAPGGAENNVNVSATASWPFARNWAATAQASITTFDALPIIPGSEVPTTQHDKRVLLGVRYEESSGVPYQTLGLRGGAGSGRLSGVVFFDENGDGIRQPNERGAAGITLYLDGRFPATTDSQGRFSFAVVTPGSHGLRILNESLPLPWSIDEDHPAVANVPLRGDTVLDIPLTKIRP